MDSKAPLVLRISLYLNCKLDTYSPHEEVYIFSNDSNLGNVWLRDCNLNCEELAHCLGAPIEFAGLKEKVCYSHNQTIF